MTVYNWDLIERLLHEVQNGADHSFDPEPYAQDHAAALAQQGEPVADVDALQAEARQYQQLLLERGFIAARPAEEGGNGRNFMLTARGSSLLSVLDSSIPGNDHPRQVLDEQADALDPTTFDGLSAKAQIA
ncbi:transcriptional regulator [Pseudomonas sp. nanlin1]|uniref:transcriptional regulator n=1 Tax=Pseudomonas sp. nanlin1 TaxID=3040605 RepID=UPI00388DE114